MSISEYIADRKATKTYKENIFIFKEYKIEHKWGGLVPVFPDLPKADDEYHVLMMNFKGIYPSITDILTQQKPEISNGLKTNELSNYLFVFVKIKPQLLSISSPDGGYRLGDGHIINATIDINYQIKDVKGFWLSADDPMTMFQRAVINEARKYFFIIKSEYLIKSPGDSKGDLEAYIHNLEKIIKEECTSSGIKIIKVYADIQLTQALSEYLQRSHEVIYKPGGMLDYYSSLQQIALQREQVDKVINNDPTFHPFNLQQIITALDIGLKENFYNLQWTEAMQKVHDAIRERKKSYLSDHKKVRINGIRDLLRIAEAENLGDVEVSKLKDKLLREMNIDQEHDSPLFSDRQFLQLIMTQQIEADTSKEKNGR